MTVAIPIFLSSFMPSVDGWALLYRVSDTLWRLGTPGRYIGCAQADDRETGSSLAKAQVAMNKKKITKYNFVMNFIRSTLGNRAEFY